MGEKKIRVRHLAEWKTDLTEFVDRKAVAYIVRRDITKAAFVKEAIREKLIREGFLELS